MALFGRLSTFRSVRFIAPAFFTKARPRLEGNEARLRPRFCSHLPKNENISPCRTFADVLALIENERAKMSKTNPLFPFLRDESVPLKQRMAFAPYMLYFSLDCPDVLTYWMKIDKPEDELNEVEKRINTFVNEDNFHYNFYLRDLETLGWSQDKFGSTSGVLRHVWATESSAVRTLMYAVVSSLRRSTDPLVTLTVVELLEAGLYDLFTIVYKHIAKAPEGMAELQYFGDNHVLLEKQHSVTSWFSDEEAPSLSIPNSLLSSETSAVVKEVVPDVMSRFDAMYYAFYEIVKRGDANIHPEKYHVKGTPPIDKITQDWREIRVEEVDSTGSNGI